MIEEFTLAAIKEGFTATEWGFDLYEENSWFSKHINILKTPFDDCIAIELLICWATEYAVNSSMFQVCDLGNSYLSKVGVTWLPPDYSEKNEAFLFNPSDSEFITTQGLHFIKNWFKLWESLDIQIGLSEFQGKFKSDIPTQFYEFLGFSCNRHTKRLDRLSFLYAMKGDYKKSLNYLKRYGITTHIGYEWTQEMAQDLEHQKCKIIKPFAIKDRFVRCGGVFIDENSSQSKQKI